jgi:hypothetical protein
VTVAQAEKLVRVLIAAYPEVAMREETVATYVRFLVDLEQGAAVEAIEDLIATSVAMPTVASIRRQVINEELRLPPPAEAWVSINDSTRTEALHDLAKEARDLMGGSWAIRTSDQPSITRAQYLKIYEELRERTLQEANRRSRRGRPISAAKG